MPDFYNAGTVSVDNGATTVTGSTVLWSSVQSGDTLELAGQSVTIASVTDTNHVELAAPWTGTTQSGATYTIRYNAPARFSGITIATSIRRALEKIAVLEQARPNYEVQSLGSNTPPGSPVERDMYVVGTSPTGAWSGQANNLAQWTGSAYQFTAPEAGTTVVSAATGVVSVWNGTAWTTFQTALGFTPVNKAGDTMGGRLVAAGGVQGNNGIGTATPNLGEFEVCGNGTGAAAMAFHRPGAMQQYFGLDTDNAWKIGGSSLGANSYRLIHQGNIVGPVSQSGGAVTGSIVERGSNANGDYTKFADGTMICSRRHLRAPGVIAAGAFVSLGAYTFPAAFSAAPVVTSMYDGGWSVYIMASVQGVTVAGLGGAYFTNVGTADRDTTGTNPTFHYIAVGRWF